ncbi:hypothetical protein Vadar_014864 [Vaccinium darrowii]|uniref:Uncharacterized protein n=1 Tax=Vaccinium darrowii TaxID=229202 RepID=A0ACB7X0W8_9ERIC|nr:hypothetical protein Vadar_014864 [Vaccinium darrowii]
MLKFELRKGSASSIPRQVLFNVGCKGCFPNVLRSIQECSRRSELGAWKIVTVIGSGVTVRRNWYLDVLCVLKQTQEVRLWLNVDVAVPSESSPAPPQIESFTDMCLHSSIMKDIAFHDYSTPTSIQAQAMPVALSGKDLLGCTETGSGKTAAFAIPMIQHCLAQPPVCRGDGPLALVLAPTRELAQQIEKEEYLTDPVRVKVGKVSSPTANVAQFLVKVSDNEKKGHKVSLNV